MEDHATQLSFYIPLGLEPSASRTDSRLPALETLLARGNTTHVSSHGDLLALFGGNPADGNARAAVSHFAQSTTGSGEWRIIASPVHLLADHATLHFPPQPHALLNDAESMSLMKSCQEHFTEEGWQLEYGNANNWYLHTSGSTAIKTTPLDEAVGRPLFDTLPKGNDYQTWLRWSNEVQMLFHGHAVNQARRSRGELAINSLWFWGEGRLPELSSRRYKHVFGGDRYVQGLALLSGAQWSPLPESLLDVSANGGPSLIVLDAFSPSHWEDKWFTPLHNLLKGKTITGADLHFRNGYSTHLSHSMLWRFWRRKHFSLKGWQ